MVTTDVFTSDPSMPPPAQPQDRSRSQSPQRNARHAKGLSLNVPILLPTQYPSAANSPGTASPTNASTITPPTTKNGLILANKEAAQSYSGTNPDFLTLVAAHERRVLELREELAKADAELTTLKKQWAVYEANKKRDEVRQVRNMAVPLGDVPSHGLTAVDQGELEEERRRRKTLVEMNANTTAGQIPQDPHIKPGRRGSKRVFGGRHTKTLSLLSPTSTKPASIRSLDDLIAPDESCQSEQPFTNPHVGTTSLSRMPTLDGLVSPDKTYQSLAAHRRSLPPGAADMFMKQSKQVVDGVREGLWTFFEDIRQATVGDEAVNGPVTRPGASRQSKHPPRPTRTKRKPGKPQPALKDDSFWTEFGLATPKRSETGKENATGHLQQNSTDSQIPPGLLEDVHGDENDDDWENWESPASIRKQPLARAAPTGGEGLPWPELKKLTPSKLTRTASDLMREWQDDSQPGVGKDSIQDSIMHI
jgi:Domain of unknown function (DUF4048)